MQGGSEIPEHLKQELEKFMDGCDDPSKLNLCLYTGEDGLQHLREMTGVEIADQVMNAKNPLPNLDAKAFQAMMAMETINSSMRSHNARIENEWHEQVHHALRLLRESKKPLKWGYISQQFRYKEYRGVQAQVQKHEHVRRKVFKNKRYLEWVGPR